MKNLHIDVDLKSIFIEFKEKLINEFYAARSISQNLKFWVILGVDIVLLLVALYLSYFLRYEGGFNADGSFSVYWKLYPLILAIKIPVFYIFGLYRGMWRYTSTQDLFNIIKATVFSFSIVLIFLVYINRLSGLSRSVFIIDAILSFLLICGHRISIRYYYRGINGFTDNGNKKQEYSKSDKKKRLLLIGAGDAAEKVVRELRTNPNLPYIPVGLIDDKPGKVGLKIHGVPVLGLVDDLGEHVIRTHADEILIAIARARREEMNRLLNFCQKVKLPCKVIPGFGEIIDGNVSIKKIRDFSAKDLLGREEIKLEQDQIGSYIKGRKILITGAGGSIGSELCRQVLRFHPRQIILYDISEENLHNIEMELVHEFEFNNLIVILGKIQDVKLLNKVFQQNTPDVVLHAAAYKHVPLIERNPWEAVFNNILATQLLIEASIIYNVECFVLVSTDKAVRPSSLMGASKRFTELIMHSYSSNNWNRALSDQWKINHLSLAFDHKRAKSCHNSRLMAVRFGNVLGSSGSVVPLFKQQIERGGPVTVTHPEMTRYFMSIEEAAQLILQAGAMGGYGEIFILKMGEPVNIDHMAREMIRLAGKTEDEIEIVYTGLRPGEKLYEELITVGEDIISTNHQKILVLQNVTEHTDNINNLVSTLIKCAENHDVEGIIRNLKNVIPDYNPFLEN